MMYVSLIIIHSVVSILLDCNLHTGIDKTFKVAIYHTDTVYCRPTVASFPGLILEPWE